MEKKHFSLKNGSKFEVEVGESKGGNEYVMTVHTDAVAGSTTVTCTCSGGKSTTKTCPNGNNTCDCSDPQNPQITCG